MRNKWHFMVYYSFVKVQSLAPKSKQTNSNCI